MRSERTSGPADLQSDHALPRPRALPQPLAYGAAIMRPALARLLAGRVWRGLKVAFDLVALVVGCVVGLLVAPASDGTWLLAFFPPLALVFLHSRGRYVDGLRDVVLTSAAPGFGAVSISAMALLALHVLQSGGGETLSSTIVATWLASLATVSLTGLGITLAERAARRRGIAASPTLIIGTDVTGLDVALRLQLHPEYGLRPVGFLDTITGRGAAPGDPPWLGQLEDLERVTALYRVRNVVIGFPHASDRAMLELVARCDALGLETNVVPRLWATINSQTRFEYLGTVPLLNLRAIDLESWRFAVKHAIDKIGATVLLAVLSPLLAAIAVAVRLSSPGPILFKQLRAGRDGRVFALLKFRTMTAGGSDAGWALDPGLAPGGVEGVDRRTRAGRFLRRTSLDELPQLFNVLRGEMSLVGPRPERPEFIELFRREVENYRERHRVRAGLTGWAQIHGSRGQTPLADRVELDNFYIEHWSLALDIRILLLTIPALLKGS